MNEPRPPAPPGTLLVGAAVGTAVGIALSVLDAPGFGSLLTVGSLLGLVYGVHRFGRLGPEAGTARRRRRPRAIKT